MNEQMKKLLSLAAAFLIAALVDRLTKNWALANLAYASPLPVVGGFFNLTLVYNKGAAFGIFSNFEDGLRQILLAAAAAVALLSVVYFLAKEYRGSVAAHIAVGFILGGALGNIIDRISFGYVIDFLDFYVGQNHWPAFNIADSAICVGVFALIFTPSCKTTPKPQQK